MLGGVLTNTGLAANGVSAASSFAKEMKMSKAILGMITALSLTILAAGPAAAGCCGCGEVRGGLHRHGEWHVGYVHWRHNYLFHRH